MAYKIDPWGEDRADLRQAINTASMIGALSLGEITDEQFNEQINALRNYLGDGSESGTAGFVSPNAAAAMVRGLR